MQGVVGIICEYNPFHNGHRYQIDQIRRKIPNATIVAIMSGNIVQRGEFALFDKYTRARVALECGANAVFELPYPYCGSTAEIFASAGVHLATRLGCEQLFFGTEELQLKEIEEIAKAVETKELEDRIKEELKSKEIGFIQAKSNALKSLGYNVPRSSNDMLAVEYIRAIMKGGSKLKYGTVVRQGASYNSTELSPLMSATAIRKHFYEDNELLSVPDEARAIYSDAIDKGDFLNTNVSNQFLQSYSLLNIKSLPSTFDSSLEIAAIVREASKNTVSSGFIDSLSSKSYTNARIKRVLLYNLFGITRVDFKPRVTFLLGMDKKGRELLASNKEKQGVCIVTKHSDLKHASASTKKIAETVYKVDEIYNTLLKSPRIPSQAYKNKPILK